MGQLRPLSIGSRFGSFTVTSYKSGRTVSVKCDCGRQLAIDKYNLTGGKSKSCGKGSCSPNFKNLVGKTFGFLTVLSLSGNRNGNGAIWLCSCVCGNKPKVRAHSLLQGRTKSCGCQRRVLVATKTKLPGDIAVCNQLYSTYRQMANRRSLSFDLSREEFTALIRSNCHYCGVSPYQTLQKTSRVFGSVTLKYNGVDRKNNRCGYKLTNCVPACGLCNRAKNNLSYDDFKAWIDRLVSFNSVE